MRPSPPRRGRSIAAVPSPAARRAPAAAATAESIHIVKILDEACPACPAGEFARSAGRPAKRPGLPWLARSGLNWHDLAAPGALAVSIWPRMARSACSWHPCWIDVAALCGPGRPTGSIWLPNECPIDTISQKNRFAYRRSCFDAACFVRSDTFLHASNLVCYIILCETPLIWFKLFLCMLCHYPRRTRFNKTSYGIGVPLVVLEELSCHFRFSPTFWLHCILYLARKLVKT